MVFRRAAKQQLLSRTRFGGQSAPFPFECEHTTFWYRGQSALWQGLRSLGLPAGARILAPAYHCGSEVDVLVKAGVSVEFYRLESDLNPDIDHVRTLLDEPAHALYIINYFGFPPRMADVNALVSEYGLRLIEDNALGLYSETADGVPFGSVGDFSIFSFRKTLSVPDGGALYINAASKAPAVDESAIPPPKSLMLKLLLSRAAQEIIYRNPLNVGSGVAKATSAPLRDTEFPIEIGSWGMSGFSSSILRHVDHDFVLRRRRANYEAIRVDFKASDSLRPLFAELPDGACPLAFLVWADDPDGLLRHVYARGGRCAPPWRGTHPSLKQESFPFEMDLTRQLLAFPIHQDLDQRDTSFLLDVLNSWKPV